MTPVEFDLHIHTCYSDGSDTPDEIIAKAIAAGLRGIALVDHDFLCPLPAPQPDITVIRGIEFSTDIPNLHILGYGLSEENTDLRDYLDTEHQKRMLAISAMCVKLSADNFPVSLDDIYAIKRVRGGAVCRPHLAAALIHKKIVRAPAEAYQRFIGTWAPYYVDYKKPTFREIIDNIHRWGGIAVLAHPGVIAMGGRETIIERCVAAGIDGIEIMYPKHRNIQKMRYLNLCEANRLLITGGSDYHGVAKPRLKIGMCGIDRNQFDKLLAEINKRNCARAVCGAAL